MSRRMKKPDRRPFLTPTPEEAARQQWAERAAPTMATDQLADLLAHYPTGPGIVDWAGTVFLDELSRRCGFDMSQGFRHLAADEEWKKLSLTAALAKAGEIAFKDGQAYAEEVREAREVLTRAKLPAAQVEEVCAQAPFQLRMWFTVASFEERRDSDPAFEAMRRHLRSRQTAAKRATGKKAA